MPKINGYMMDDIEASPLNGNEASPNTSQTEHIELNNIQGSKP